MFKVGDKVIVLKYWAGDVGIVERVNFPLDDFARSYSAVIEECRCGSNHNKNSRGAWNEGDLVVLPPTVSPDQIEALRNILCSK